MSDTQELLRVSHLCCDFNTKDGILHAVNDVSFSINKGEVFGLVGESGCGKSTLGRTLVKLYTPVSGEVFLDGARICAGTGEYVLQMNKLSEQYKKQLSDIRMQDSLSYRQKRQMISSLSKEHSECMRVCKQNIRSARKDTKAVNATDIQMIFQDPTASLDPRMTVKELISEGLLIRGERDSGTVEHKVMEMLSLVGLSPEHAERYPHEFSGGQRQRIGIARSLVTDPRLLIADEPISALDVSVKAQIINLLGYLRESLGLAVLFIAHDLSVVKYFCDRVGVMYKGRLVELAPSHKLFSHPTHPYTRSLLSAIPVPDPITERSRKRITGTEAQSYLTTGQLRQISDEHFVLCGDGM